MENMPFISIPLSGRYGKGKVVLVDGDYDGEYFSLYKWYVNPQTGLAYRQDYVDGKNVTIMLHNKVARPPKGVWVKHVDGNKLNNRSCNLKWITPSESALTRRLPVGAKELRGVSHPMSKAKGGKLWVSKRWQAVIKGKHIGTFDTEEEAARAYDKAAKELYGDLARLNYPD